MTGELRGMVVVGGCGGPAWRLAVGSFRSRSGDKATAQKASCGSLGDWHGSYFTGSGVSVGASVADVTDAPALSETDMLSLTLTAYCACMC